MPTSWYHTIPAIIEQIHLVRPNSILDVGIGFGKYGVLIRDALELPFQRYHKNQWKVKLDGVEAFPGYKNPLHDFIYDKIFYCNVNEIIDQLPKYDVILLIDILEHFSKEEGIHLIRKLLNYTNKFLLISTPLYPADQDDYLGNKFERHKSRWVLTDFLDFDFSYRLVPIGENGAQLITVFPTHYGGRTALNIDKTLTPAASKGDPLTIGYILPHKNLTGGLKMLLEQMRHLRTKGHRVIALGKTNGANSVLPEWYSVEVDEEIVVSPNRSFLDYIGSCDVVMAGWVSQLPELVGAPVPIVYWEQGHEWLFGDCGDLSWNSPVRRHLAQCYRLPCYLAAVSPTVAKILKVRYNREAFVIPNGIDTDVYHPGQRHNDGTILLVGNPMLRFKGFEVALKTLQKVWDCGFRFRVKWVCQNRPQVKGISFPISFIISPSQEELAEHYRNADIFLFTSWYEGFGMPPLEAMASGVPVVATLCGGIDGYAVPGENALLADPGDIDSLAYAVMYLLQHEEARNILAERGRETAMKFRFTDIICLLENYLRKVVLTHNSR